MKVYGTQINSDIVLPLDLPTDTATRGVIDLIAHAPDELIQSVGHASPFYFAHGRDVYLHSDCEHNQFKAGQTWCYEVKGVVRFYWLGGEPVIYYELDEKGTIELLAFWFIHLMLPLYFTLEDKYDFLHAGAVEVDGKPILFIAPSMGGKSTMTDYFIRQGHTLISDDKVATFSEDGQFMLTGSHPYHRPYRKYEDLGYRVDHFIKIFKPIHTIYMLEAADAEADIDISEVVGYKKFDALMPNYLFMFSHLKSQRLAYLAAMLNQIRLFQVTVPWEMERLGDVHDVITKNAKGLE